ncbi:MAG: hypothetical protein WCT39_05080 [Candidatus Margulisiibacteriota bacterium]
MLIPELSTVKTQGQSVKIKHDRRSVLSILRQNKYFLGGDFYGAVKTCATCFGGRVYLTRDHHTAPVHWARGIVEGKLGYRSLLLHVDAHPDLKFSIVPVDRRVMGANGIPVTLDALMRETKRVVKMSDSYPDLTPEECFVQSAIELGIIGEYVHIIPGDDGSFSLSSLAVPSSVHTLESFLHRPLLNGACTVILGIDLDFFSALPGMPYNRPANLGPDLDKLISILRLFNPGIITITFSPFSTGLVHRYLTINEEQCADVIVRVLEALNLLESELKFVDEPRRDMRFSPK